PVPPDRLLPARVLGRAVRPAIPDLRGPWGGLSGERVSYSRVSWHLVTRSLPTPPPGRRRRLSFEDHGHRRGRPPERRHHQIAAPLRAGLDRKSSHAVTLNIASSGLVVGGRDTAGTDNRARTSR